MLARTQGRYTIKRNYPPVLKDRRSGALAVALALLFGLTGPPGAQIKADPQKPLQYEVIVTLKLVQVYVTGKGGQPVDDLALGEFEVTDNGQPVSVTHFEKHFLGQPEETAGGPATGAPMNRKFFLIFDFGFIDPHGVLKAKNAGLHFVDNQLQPSDEVGLLSFHAFKGLVLHEYLTTDHAKVRRIVDGFGLKKYAGRAENLSDYLFAASIEDAMAARGQDTSQPASPEEQFFQKQARLQAGLQVDDGARQSYAERARYLVESLDNFARTIRYIPGYKNIIFFSGGLARQLLYGKKTGATVSEWSTPEQLIAQLNQYDAAQADTGIRSDYTAMLDQFKAANAPVYAVDVSSPQKEGDVSNDREAGLAVRELEGADSLRQLASGTGGKFYPNTVDYKKIMDNIQNITGAYYVLGYSVSEKWDGKFHKIKVRVKRKGCDVISQGGYFSPKPFSEYTSFEKLLHVIDLALSEIPQLQVPVEVPVSALAVTVRGWPQLVALTRASKTVHSDVIGKKSEAYLLLLDENGEVSLIKRFRLRLPDEASNKQVFFPSFLLTVKAGRYTCRMVLRNMDTGNSARGSASLVVPAVPAVPVVLDPPLLLTLESESLEMPASEGGALSTLFGYDPSSFAPLVGAVPAGQNKLFAALRLSSNIPNPDYEISASLQESTAPAATAPAVTAVPVTIMKKAQDGPATLLLVELGTGELGPGPYSLRVEAKEKARPSSYTTAMEFTVK